MGKNLKKKMDIQICIMEPLCHITKTKTTL